MNLKSRKDEFVKRIEDITSVVIDKVVKKNTISLTDTPSHLRVWNTIQDSIGDLILYGDRKIRKDIWLDLSSH